MGLLMSGATTLHRRTFSVHTGYTECVLCLSILMFSEHDISGGFSPWITPMGFLSCMNALLVKELRHPDAGILTSSTCLGFLNMSLLTLKDLEFSAGVFFTFRDFNCSVPFFMITTWKGLLISIKLNGVLDFISSLLVS